MLRSRGDYGDVNNVSDTLTYRTLQLASGLVMNPLNTGTNSEADFVLSATNNTTSAITTYDVSLDTTSRNYLPRVLGSDFFDRDALAFVEEIYPNKLNNLIENGYILGLNTGLTYVNGINGFSNYKQQWQTPETPWVVSELRGNVVQKLFKFVSI